MRPTLITHPSTWALTLVRRAVEIALFAVWLGWWYALEVTVWQTPDGSSIPTGRAAEQFWATRAPYWFAGYLMAEEMAHAAALTIGAALLLVTLVVAAVVYRTLRSHPTKLPQARRVSQSALRIWAGILLMALLLTWIYLPFVLAGGPALPVGTPLDVISTGLPEGWTNGDTRFAAVLMLVGVLPALPLAWVLIRRVRKGEDCGQPRSSVGNPRTR